jgi:hypothetical protein
MNYAQFSRYLQRLGYQAEVSPNGVWYRIGYGFLLRDQPYETMPPPEEEIQHLFRKYSLLGLIYSTEVGSPGKTRGVYLVRNHNYDLKDLQKKERNLTRRGLENCQVRLISFEELHDSGMPLNRDTLARQGRDDSLFSDPERWARLCLAGREVDGAQAWGAFVDGELAAYALLFQIGEVQVILHQMSSTRLRGQHPNPALIFTVTQTMMRTPGIEAVCFGTEGLSSSDGLDLFKQRMGYQKEPVVFSVRLNPAVRLALLNRVTRHTLASLGSWRSNSDFLRRVNGILEIAALS